MYRHSVIEAFTRLDVFEHVTAQGSRTYHCPRLPRSQRLSVGVTESPGVSYSPWLGCHLAGIMSMTGGAVTVCVVRGGVDAIDDV